MSLKSNMYQFFEKHSTIIIGAIITGVGTAARLGY